VDGDKVTVGQQKLNVIHCQGHIIFFHEASKLAIVGDVLFNGSIGRTDFPKGNFKTLGKSVRFIPGHDPMSTFGEEMKNNPFVKIS